MARKMLDLPRIKELAERAIASGLERHHCGYEPAVVLEMCQRIEELEKRLEQERKRTGPSAEAMTEDWRDKSGAWFIPWAAVAVAFAFLVAVLIGVTP